MNSADGTTPRWQNRPAGSTWGDFGPDDELGRLNLITPAKVLDAVKEVQEGLSFCLSLPLNLPAGNRGDRFPPRLFPTGGGKNMNHRLSERFPGATGVSCDDAVELCLQYSTQWDGLSHFGCEFDADGDGQDEIVYYNGWRAGEHVIGIDETSLPPGAHRLGIERYAEKAIQTRGVLIDFERQFGSERQKIDFDMLQKAMTAQSVSIAPGDILCLHSGIGRILMDLGTKADLSVFRHKGAELDGADERILNWITQSGVAAIAADNFAVEWFQKIEKPGAEPRPILPLHEHCLFRLGVPLGELWWLTPLAEALQARKRNRFLLTAPPLRLPRAVGSPLTPVATI